MPSYSSTDPSATTTTTTGNAISSAAVAVANANARYSYDTTALENLRSSSPWMSNPHYFTSVAIGPVAIMKMMTHCHSGVTKGIKSGGNPIEVMGLLLGRPDPNTPHTLVVTDVFPLPIEGFETRVVADDNDVINHMIALGESLEPTRREKFMGWYHSHPFDYVAERSHCFLSQTDVSTQLQWQRAEDCHGNPFLAIVVDPLRSLVKNVPEIKAFRAYPPEYTHPVPYTCPNGEVIREEQSRLEKWGSCYASYYELSVEYYMSSGARYVLSSLTKNFLWMRALGSGGGGGGRGGLSEEREERQCRHAEGICAAAERINKFLPETSSGSSATTMIDRPSALMSSKIGGGGGSGSRMMTSAGERASSSSSPILTTTTTATTASTPSLGKKGKDDDDEDGLGGGGELGKPLRAILDIATEELVDNIVQMTKRQLFTQS